jgi:hypothetical protein
LKNIFNQDPVLKKHATFFYFQKQKKEKLCSIKLFMAAINEGISAVSFCRQVAEWFPDMFRDFYLVKNHKIHKNSTTTKAR